LDATKYFSLDSVINGKKHQTSGCFFRQCVVDDFCEIVKIQEKIVEDLVHTQNEDLFIPTGNSEIKMLLGRDDVFFVGVQAPDGLCAYSCTFFGLQEYELGCHFDDKKVATFDTVVVLPGYRGNKLQKRLQEISEIEAKKRCCDIIAATVSLDNLHSRSNMIENGYVELKTISYEIRRKKIERLVVYKDLCV